MRTCSALLTAHFSEMNNEGDWSFFNGLENIKNGISNVFQGISNLFSKNTETNKLPYVSGRRSKFLNWGVFSILL